MAAFVIASKNVGLVARTVEDVNKYEDSKFQFAKLIGRVWFNYLDSIEKKGLLQQFKSEIADQTLIGEYIGNQDY